MRTAEIKRTRRVFTTTLSCLARSLPSAEIGIKRVRSLATVIITHSLVTAFLHLRGRIIGLSPCRLMCRIFARESPWTSRSVPDVARHDVFSRQMVIGLFQRRSSVATQSLLFATLATSNVRSNMLEHTGLPTISSVYLADARKPHI